MGKHSCILVIDILVIEYITEIIASLGIKGYLIHVILLKGNIKLGLKIFITVSYFVVVIISLFTAKVTQLFLIT